MGEDDVGYLGPPGTFGEQAALLYDSSAARVPFPSHTHVVKAVASGAVQQGVLAIENSLEGSVTESEDALTQAEDVAICAELVLPVEHNLIAAPATSLDAIDVVMSHPQAIGQCRAYLERYLPSVRFEAALSTAAAVEEAVQTPRVAAIGTRRAAELFGGVILAPGIQDAAHNKTRFVVIALADAAPTGDDKTSIAFTVPNRPGALLGVMRELSDRGLNMTRITSRPSREDLGVYVFYIDFQGHRQDAGVDQALAGVRRNAQTLRLFGSYPRYAEPAG